MTRPTVRLSVEVLEDRWTPSASFDAPPALFHLSAALDRVGQIGPPIRVSPVFALNFGSPSTETLPALTGLTTAGTHVLNHGPPISPVFYGLANFITPPTT